jgi:hypothetical protein
MNLQFTPFYPGLGALNDDFCGTGPHFPLPHPGIVSFPGGIAQFNVQTGAHGAGGGGGAG